MLVSAAFGADQRWAMQFAKHIAIKCAAPCALPLTCSVILLLLDSVHLTLHCLRTLRCEHAVIVRVALRRRRMDRASQVQTVRDAVDCLKACARALTTKEEFRWHRVRLSACLPSRTQA
eukprot:3251220-Pleurochrysis_carterae.AAC.2